MPRTAEIHKRNFNESLFQPDVKLSLDAFTTLGRVLDESITAIPYSSTLTSNSYFDEKEQKLSKKRICNMRKNYPTEDSDSLYTTAKMLNVIDSTEVGDCQEIILDAHYRCKKYKFSTEMIAISDNSGKQSHVVLGFRSNDKNYIFDIQHGNIYPCDTMHENLKLWDDENSTFVMFDETQHKQVEFLPSLLLEDVMAIRDNLRMQSQQPSSDSPQPFKRRHLNEEKSNSSKNDNNDKTCSLM